MAKLYSPELLCTQQILKVQFRRVETCIEKVAALPAAARSVTIYMSIFLVLDFAVPYDSSILPGKPEMCVSVPCCMFTPIGKSTSDIDRERRD